MPALSIKGRCKEQAHARAALLRESHCVVPSSRTRSEQRMIRPLDVGELEHQVNAAIAYPPSVALEASFRAADKPLPLESLYNILDREIVHRQARHPDER